MLGLDLPTLIARVITLVLAFTIHEFAHAWSADQLGDDTPRLNGRLTLNPLAHLDPLGSLMLIVAGFGWAKPVPINPFVLESRRPYGTMLVAAAGPFSNLIMAVMASIPIQMGLIDISTPSGAIFPSLGAVVANFIFINLILMLFNMVPIFPLDGEKVLVYFLPSPAKESLLGIRPYGPFLLMGLLFLGPMIGINIFSSMVGAPAQQLFSLLVL